MAKKSKQTRVRRRCLDRVLCGLMHRCVRSAYRGSASDASADLPGVRTSLRDLLCRWSEVKKAEHKAKKIKREAKRRGTEGK